MLCVLALAALTIPVRADPQDDVHGLQVNPYVKDWFDRRNAAEHAPAPPPPEEDPPHRPLPMSIVGVQLALPAGGNPKGVSVWLSGGSRTDREDRNESTTLDETGTGYVLTRRTGYHFLVVRSPQHDIALAGSAHQLAAPQAWQRGRLFLQPQRDLIEPDLLFTGLTHDIRPGHHPLMLTPKTPGKARFVFAAEDSEALRESIGPEAGLEKPGKVWVTGDWNGFSLVSEEEDPLHGAKLLHDDGAPASGDDQAGDAVFTRVLDLPAGVHAYAFLVSPDGARPRRFTRDPYEEGMVVWPLNTGQRVSTISVP